MDGGAARMKNKTDYIRSNKYFSNRQQALLKAELKRAGIAVCDLITFLRTLEDVKHGV